MEWCIFRKSQYTVWDDSKEPSAEEVSSVEPTSSTESGDDSLRDDEHEFVEQSVEQLGKPNRKPIRGNIERNRDEFEREPNSEEIIVAVMNEIGAEVMAD